MNTNKEKERLRQAFKRVPTEKQMWRKLSAAFKKLYGRNGFCMRVETPTMRGVPDCFFIAREVVAWCELKRLYYMVSPSQQSWHLKYTRAGGRVTVLRAGVKRVTLGVRNAAGYIQEQAYPYPVPWATVVKDIMQLNTTNEETL